MNKNSKKLSIILVVVLLFNIVCIPFVNASNSKVSVKVENKYNNDAMKVEEGTIELNLNNNKIIIKYKDKYDGSKKITELKYGKTTEIIESDFKSNTYSITRNGVKNVFSRNEAIKRTKNFIANSNNYTMYSGISDELGTPYSDREVAVGSFSCNGSYEVARVKAYYDWEPTEYDTFIFSAFTAISTIAAILTMGTSTLISMIASMCTMLGGVLVIQDALTVDYNAYEQNWNKWGEVDDDIEHYFHYHAGRTRVIEIYEFSNGETIVEELRDVASSNFYDNMDILDITIDNYIMEHSY